MVSSQLHYTKRNRFMPFLMAEILNFQGSTHRTGVGSFSKIIIQVDCCIKHDFQKRKIGMATVSHDFLACLRDDRYTVIRKTNKSR